MCLLILATFVVLDRKQNGWDGGPHATVQIQAYRSAVRHWHTRVGEPLCRQRSEGGSTQALCFLNAQKFREDRPERKPGSIVEGDTDARASVFTLAFCQAFAALARGTAYDRVGTRSNENEAFCSRQHHIRVTVAADKYEPCSGIAHGKIN
jgi:hypothetical protein